MSAFRFAGQAWNRLDERRADREWLRATRAAASTRVLVFVGSEPVVVGPESAEPRLATLAGDALDGWWERARESALLGEVDGVVHYAASFAEQPHGVGGEPLSLRGVGQLLAASEAQLAACACALFQWHAIHPRCARCGAPTRSVQAGWQRRCEDEACAGMHFPRTDPAIIVLTECEGRALLGRQASWPPRVYSTLAGFVEPGESLEEAVVREVAEESGIRVEEVRYLASQPWPFPASLMLGFRARASPGEPHARDGELEDVRWFSRSELLEAVERGEVALPLRLSISRWLVEGWLAEAD